MSGKTGKKVGPSVQASINACNERRMVKREELAKRLQKHENLRLQRLYNLKKRMVVIFAVVKGEIVILTMVDPSLMSCTYSSAKNHHIVYGTPEYHLLSMMASYNPRGNRTNKPNCESYTVSTVDGINFKVVDKDGKVFSFETFMKYESLVGQNVSDVKFDQWLYDPINVESDKKTLMIHGELLKVIEHEKKNIAENPTLLKEGCVLYHLSHFA